jgi:hypothetical protein
MTSDRMNDAAFMPRWLASSHLTQEPDGDWRGYLTPRAAQEFVERHHPPLVAVAPFQPGAHKADPNFVPPVPVTLCLTHAGRLVTGGFEMVSIAAGSKPVAAIIHLEG